MRLVFVCCDGWLFDMTLGAAGCDGCDFSQLTSQLSGFFMKANLQIEVVGPTQQSTRLDLVVYLFL